MFKNLKIVNKSKVAAKVALKNLIAENYTKENGKFFYSLEITPKEGLEVDFTKLKTLPLFVDSTWLKDDNLKFGLGKYPAVEARKMIKCTQAVNSITCCNLTDEHLDQILNDDESIRNFTVLRGDMVNENQKFKFASELIAAIRQKADGKGKQITIFAGGYPGKHVEAPSEDVDLKNLKAKVDAGADAILTQVTFSADKFAKFVENCRAIGVKVPIIPGLYIPRTFAEFKLLQKFTNFEIPAEIHQKLEDLKDDSEGFEKFSLSFIVTLIHEMQQKSPEHIRGFHFFTMNNLTMIQKLTELVDFSEE